MTPGRAASLAARIAVSGICVGILAARYGRDEGLRATLGRLEPGAFAGAVALLAGGLVVSALRWKVLLDAAGVRVGFGRTARLVFVGYFFSALLPTTIGGDVVRALALRGTAPLSVVGGSIVVERLLGFGCLLGLGLAGSWMSEGLAAARTALLLAAAGFVAGVGVLLFGRVPAIGEGGGVFARLARAAARLVGEVRAFGFHGRALAAAGMLALVWQLSLVAVHAVLARGFGDGAAPFGHLAVLVPVVQALAMIPVSLGGLGIREMGYEYFFRASGYDPASGVALGLGWLAVSTAVALAGGALHALRPTPLREEGVRT